MPFLKVTSGNSDADLGANIDYFGEVLQLWLLM